MEYRKHPLTGEWIIHQRQLKEPFQASDLCTSFLWNGACIPLHKKLRSTPMQNMTRSDFAELFDAYFDWVKNVRSVAPQACIPSILDPHAGVILYDEPVRMIVAPADDIFADVSIKRARSFHTEHKRCLWCEMIDQELSCAERIVESNDDFIVFEPYAARFPFETYIVPIRHIHSFISTPALLIDALARLCAKWIPVIHDVSGKADFAFFLHHVATPCGYEDYLHWYIQVVPFMNTWAGFEIATAMNINVTTPESCVLKISQKIHK
ncbi:MAG: hypothetical protein RBU23_10790 [Candidatus Auribacterota bacterium]|jgi:UDPglucose--hexose-1-phosphate uridylyltransferase|nr:hypothetical protein [Candidatus Auribacterota bacterium]